MTRIDEGAKTARPAGLDACSIPGQRGLGIVHAGRERVP